MADSIQVDAPRPEVTSTNNPTSKPDRWGFLNNIKAKFRRETPTTNIQEPDSTNQTDSLKPYKQSRFNRRRFLQGSAAVVATGTIASSGQLEKAAINGLMKLFDDPKHGEDILHKAAESLGRNKENPHFRPIDLLIEEGIKVYEGQTGNKACFQRSIDYRDFAHYQKGVETASNSIGVLPTNPTKIAESLINSFPASAKSQFAAADDRIGNFFGVLSLTDQSGLYERYCEENPNDRGKSFARQDMIDRGNQKAREYITEAKEFTETEAGKNGNRPISASKLLSFFLSKNNGDIASSLNDTYIFLKFASRNNFETGEAKADDVNVNWLKNNILDEYGSSSYATESDDLVNLIGKPYHSWNLVAMLAYFPPEIIEIGGIYRQLTHIDQQRADKLQSDLLTLSELKQADETLLSHPKH